MSPARLGVLILAASVCVGCPSTGGTMLGLFPAPKFLEGTIENNVYTSEDGAFSIDVPHDEDSYEFKYMNVKELAEDDELYVSFGPAATDLTVYRLSVVMRTTPYSRSFPLDEIASLSLASYVQQLEAGYKSGIEEVESRDRTTNSRPTRYWKLKQVAPEGAMANVEVDLTHEVYVLDYDEAFVTVCVQSMDKMQTERMSTLDFIGSFVLH